MPNDYDDSRLANIRLEYSSLVARNSETITRRDEIIKTTLTLVSAMLVAAIAYPTTPSVALIYPPIAAFLAMEWTHSYIINILIACYIRDHIAPQMPGIGWENHLKNWRDQHQGSLRVFAIHSGIFFFTQLLAVFIGLTIKPVSFASCSFIMLLFIDVLAILVTIFFFAQATYDKTIIAIKNNTAS